MYQELRESVFQANMSLAASGLVVLTWGNASGVDRAKGVFAIKPSGVPYSELRAEDIPIVSLATGEVVDGTHRPSSDTPTHLHLYKSFPEIGGVVHTHSRYGTSFAQARHQIPCFGTTHADNFRDAIPCTRDLTKNEIDASYEENTGVVIVEYFDAAYVDPMEVPGILVAGHAPFAWGKSAQSAVENAIVLEFCAEMALHSMTINPQTRPISKELASKHFLRKHGAGAYYGQRE